MAIDDDLVVRARAGEIRAFEALFEARVAAMLRLAAAIVGNDDDARDAVQQASIQAWRELPHLREVNRFDAWFGRILTNACRALLRSRRRRQVREVPVASLDEATGIKLSTRSSPSPAEQTSEVDVLSRAFDRLSADARVLMALHHLEGRSLAETAARSGISIATAKWRLHEARTALERALELERR